MTIINLHQRNGAGRKNAAVGLVFYIMGASGAGKDTILDYARRNQPEGANIVFAHRYITRPSGYGSENHVALTEAEFALRLRNRCFAMHWQSHGFHYGIGVEITNWLRQGLNVVVSGSRGHLATALRLFPDLIPILVTAPEKIIAQRLAQRNREDEVMISQRLERNSLFSGLRLDFLHVLHNNGTPEQAGNDFLALITGS
jgi:ribose 1,5-bisphosphokinase